FIGTHGPRRRREHLLERVHVLDAEQEDRGVERSGPEALGRGQPSSVADDERPRPIVPAARALDELGARVDAGVARAGRGDTRREGALASPALRDSLTRAV